MGEWLREDAQQATMNVGYIVAYVTRLCNQNARAEK